MVQRVCIARDTEGLPVGCNGLFQQLRETCRFTITPVVVCRAHSPVGGSRFRVQPGCPPESLDRLVVRFFGKVAVPLQQVVLFSGKQWTGNQQRGHDDTESCHLYPPRAGRRRPENFSRSPLITRKRFSAIASPAPCAPFPPSRIKILQPATNYTSTPENCRISALPHPTTDYADMLCLVPILDETTLDSEYTTIKSRLLTASTYFKDSLRCGNVTV